MSQASVHINMLRSHYEANGPADMALQADFAASEDLGRKEVKLGLQFDVVTCMFAIHYFFASKQALDNFLHNVSINLKDGELTLHIYQDTISSCKSSLV